MNVHYGDDELSAYVLAPSLSADAEAIAQHLAHCNECRGRQRSADPSRQPRHSKKRLRVDAQPVQASW